MMNQDDQHTSQEFSFDLIDLLAFLWQKKFRIVLSAVLMVLLGMSYVIKQPPMYMATSTLLLSEESQSIALPGVAAFTGQASSKMDTHIQFLKSKGFVRSVVEKLALHERPEFFKTEPDGRKVQDLEHTVSQVSDSLSLSVVSNTNMLKVSFPSQSPQTAVDVVNLIGPAFFEFQAARSRERAANASRWLNTQIDQIRLTLSQSEEKLEAYLQEHQLVDVSSQLRLVQNEISTLMREQLLLEKALSETDASYQQVNLNRDDQQALLGLSWINSNPLVAEVRRDLQEQEQALLTISKRYKEKHHKFIEINSRLQGLRSNLTDLLAQQVNILVAERESLKLRKQQMDKQLSEAREQHNTLGRLEVELTRLRREVESNQKLYEAFLARLQETEVLKDLGNQENYSVIDYGTLPTNPFKPRITLAFVMITALALLLSSGLWLALHLVSDRQTRFRQLVKRLHLPILAEIPKLSAKRQNRNLAGVVRSGQDNYLYAEAIRSLRTAVMLNKDARETRIIVITGITKGAGKSSVALSLARSFGKLEKSLLVEADLRDPSLAVACGLDPAHPGLTDFLEKRVSFSHCLHKEPDSKLTIIPSGKIPPDPIVYLSSPRFANAIKKLGVLYERVVIMAPELNEYSDALMLAKYVDALVLVCDADRTASVELLDASQKLQEIGAPIKGIVFNKVKNLRNKLPAQGKSRHILKSAFGR